MDDGYTPFTLEVASGAPDSAHSDAPVESTPEPQPLNVSSAREPAPTPEPASPAAAPAGDPRVPQLESKVNQLLGALSIMTGGGQATQAQKDRITKEVLKQPEATVDHLTGWLEQEMNDREQRLLQRQEEIARRNNSESRWRGELTADSLGGPDRSFDEMRSKHLSPLYEANPAVRQLVQAVAAAGDGDPALIEYGLAALMKLNEIAKGNPSKAYKLFHDALDGKPSEEVVGRIRSARDAAVARIAGAGEASAPRAGGKYVPGQFRNSSDEEFEKMARDMGQPL